MKKLLLFVGLVFCFSSYSQETISTTHAFYSNFLFNEHSDNQNHLSIEGFVENIRNRVPSNCMTKVDGQDTYKYCGINEVRKMFGKVHNILFETFYTCAAGTPRAKSFSDAVDGKHTPDSHHYASLVHSALTARGIKTEFFSTPTHYGIHYQDPKTSQELYWCIITAQSNKKPASNFREFLTIFNKYKNPEINGKRNITPSDIKLLSSQDFCDQVKTIKSPI